MVFLAFWDSNNGKVHRGRGDGLPRLLGLQLWEERSGEGNGLSRLLAFLQWEGEDGEGDSNPQASNRGKVRRGMGNGFPRLLAGR